MKFHHVILAGLASLSCGLLLTGCARTDYGVGSPYQPGPVAGKTVGSAVGVTAGNVAGFGVGVVSGAAHGFAAPFDPSYHMVRYWRTETTSDGRTIQVPYDILVDQYGRPAHMPAPTGNPGPPPAVTAPPVPLASPPAATAPPAAAPMATTNGAPQ
ncbi:MAG: flagellar motor protein MotB [Verrucomicrobiia bacterium]